MDLMASELDIVFEYMQTPPVNLAAIFADLGIEYVEQPILSGESGWIERDGDKYRVVVNSNEGEQRRRFTAAHELAHYLMHRDLLAKGRLNRHTDRLFGNGAEHNREQPFSKKHEVQANKLAAQLVMPAGKIRQMIEDGASIDQLVQTFGVSKAAMKVRLDSLGQLSPTLPGIPG